MRRSHNRLQVGRGSKSALIDSNTPRRSRKLCPMRCRVESSSVRVFAGIKPPIGAKKTGGMSSCIIFGSDLAAELEFSYGAGQTVNLLALRLQWFESTPTQASPRAILQVFKQFRGQLDISSRIGFDVAGKGLVALEPGAQRARRCIDLRRAPPRRQRRRGTCRNRRAPRIVAHEDFPAPVKSFALLRPDPLMPGQP